MTQEEINYTQAQAVNTLIDCLQYGFDKGEHPSPDTVERAINLIEETAQTLRVTETSRQNILAAELQVVGMQWAALSPEQRRAYIKEENNAA